MKIVLCRPPFMDYRFGPPIGLAYLSKVSKDEGHEVVIYDVNLEIKDRIAKPLRGYTRDFVLPEHHPAIYYAYDNIEAYCENILVHEPDLVGFHLAYPTVAFGNELAKQVSKKVRCIAGGPQTSYKPQELLNLGYYDAIVVGYGEEAVLEAIKGSGIIQKPLRHSKEYYADYTNISITNYNGILPIITTRGCPNTCNFCTQNYPYFFHSIDSVVRQFQQISGIRKVMYNDSNINVNAKRTGKLFAALSQLEEKPFSHIFGMQINKGYERYISRMAEAGVREVRLGVESGSIRERRSMHKVDFDNALTLEFIKYLTAHKILAIVQFIFCFPDQTEADRQETLDLINTINTECDPHYVRHVFNKFVVHHGTEEYFRTHYGVRAQSPQTWENSLYNPQTIRKVNEDFVKLLPSNCTMYL